MKVFVSAFSLTAFFLMACSRGSSFETCTEGSVAGLSDLSAQTESASFCRTIRGEVSYQYSGLCQRKGCFFLYDVDELGTRLKGDSIYLSDTLSFPSKWKDSSTVHITRVTGDYYPAKVPCSALNDQECERAFYVRDVE